MNLNMDQPFWISINKTSNKLGLMSLVSIWRRKQSPSLISKSLEYKRLKNSKIDDKKQSIYQQPPLFITFQSSSREIVPVTRN